MTDLFNYVDEDGSTIVVRKSHDHTAYFNIEDEYNVQTACYIPRTQAMELASALIDTIEDYDHSKTFQQNYITPLDRERNRVMLDAGIDPGLYDKLPESTVKLIDAVLEARNPRA